MLFPYVYEVIFKCVPVLTEIQYCNYNIIQSFSVR